MRLAGLLAEGAYDGDDADKGFTCRVLFVFVVLAHKRRKMVHCAVTETPSGAWAGQQIANAFPLETPPKYLLRDRDGT